MCIYMSIYQFRRFIHGKHVKNFIFKFLCRAGQPHGLAGGDIRQDGLHRAGLFRNAGDIIIFLRRYGMLQRNRAGRDNTDNLAFHDPLRRFRIFHLLTNGDLIAFVDKPFYIRFRRMERHSAHRDPFFIAAGPAGQRQIQLAGSRQGVIKEHFIKIPETEKQQLIFTLLLDLQVLLHHRGQFRLFSQCMPPASGYALSGPMSVPYRHVRVPYRRQRGYRHFPR